MAFPGKYDIQYYKGDTFEFRIYPKDTSGQPFNLDNYSTAKFTISNYAGEAVAGKTKVTINAYATVDDSKEFILCAIRPVDAAAMLNYSSFVYDIEISRTSGNYDYVYTLVSGTVSVTEQVTLSAITPVPNQPGALLLSDITYSQVTCTWSAPVGGAAATGYKISVLSDKDDPTSVIGSPVTVSASTFTHTFNGLSASTEYGFLVVATNSGGDSAGSGNYTTTAIALPNAPGALVLSDVTSVSVTCTWSAPTGGSSYLGYAIAVLSNPLDPTSIIGEPVQLPANVTTYTFTGLTPATVYGFGVVAFNTSGQGSPSGNYTSTLPA